MLLLFFLGTVDLATATINLGGGGGGCLAAAAAAAAQPNCLSMVLSLFAAAVASCCLPAHRLDRVTVLQCVCVCDAGLLPVSSSSSSSAEAD